MNNWEEGEEEEFYESLDRVLSSSCSSTSASDDDGDYGYSQQHCRRSRFCTPPAASFDVWLSEPGSVEERRRRLLHHLGLAADPSLSLGNHSSRTPLPREGEIERSVSSGAYCSRPNAARACSATAAFSRSRSDGSVESALVSRHRKPTAGKPPLFGRSRPAMTVNVEEVEGAGSGAGDDEDVHEFVIKNLDNGKEFVVKELGEDGMWNTLREIGSGRHLSVDEFELCVGSSPIVQELMRRQNGEDRGNSSGRSDDKLKDRLGSSGGARPKRRSNWLKGLKNVVAAGNQRDRRSSDEKDTSSEKGGRRSSSATDDSQDTPQWIRGGPERVKVRHYGKSHKELTALFLNQEIRAHNGSIWAIKFSLDGRYMATAGEDCIIHVWQVLEHERKQELLVEEPREENGNGNVLLVANRNSLTDEMISSGCLEGNHWDKKGRTKVPHGRKFLSSDVVVVPEHVFTLSERPIYSLVGHLDDVLDLSWSESQFLLSSSMDKTVRLWNLASSSCLKVFSHNDYVTCIQFNPIDDRYFISGSLDAKVRLWSVPDRQVVDWIDLHEMVTAVCYTPDGQGALVGSHKGNCHLFDTSDNKLLQKNMIDLQNKKKKSSQKKITGFQFASGSSSEVVITSADSRIRLVDGNTLIHKFKGFRNTSSQISASLTANGKYVISASEDSQVYVWRYDADTHPNRSKGVVTLTQSYEHFRCLDVTVAVPWPDVRLSSGRISGYDEGKQSSINCTANSKSNSAMVTDAGDQDSPFSQAYRCLNTTTDHVSDRMSATWPEEKLLPTSGKHSFHRSGDLSGGSLLVQSRLAWGMVIVTGSRGGEIRVFQNFGLPVRV
ncbi:hypothetical protein HPP92_020325 [Vanilla planifolia]|uniref:WD repeat-containing protein 44 n=1 Tax=Vanilla planifolia TaxID=51239 RepID=A0A835PU52_VANPL|nr:hypothetical protein HPP92_020728 [Vanilla planifolia]KAG0461849.1 hypothetical protein HPP92_020325 [Vanilla planifolia]